MAMGQAFTEAVDIGIKQPSLDIGAHLTLVAAKPILPVDKIRSLVDSEGNFFSNHMDFINKYVRGQISLQEVYNELQAQISCIKQAGIPITHLDSHQHLHVLPAILDICLTLAKEYNIKAMRIPAEGYLFTGGYSITPSRLIGKCGLTFLARRAQKIARASGIFTPDYFFGMLAGGHLSSSYLINILKALPKGTSEIMMHPGANTKALNNLYHWDYHWDEELNAVILPDTLAFIQQNHIKMRSFREFTDE